MRDIHQVTVITGKQEAASELLPRVHRVVSLLKRWLMGPTRAPVSRKHLGYYLDESTFRFNRRKFTSRGKLSFAWYKRRRPSAQCRPAKWFSRLSEPQNERLRLNPWKLACALMAARNNAIIRFLP